MIFKQVCSQTVSGEDLNNIGISKLICKGSSEQIMMFHLCGSAEYTTFLCFSIKGGDVMVPAPSRTWVAEGFLERSLMCSVVTGLECVFV